MICASAILGRGNAMGVLRGLMCLQDAVYNPKITRLLREAEESGATIVTGLEMFIGQAYEQLERFTGLSGELSGYYTLFIHGMPS
ncbi:hypothetical protein POTOM_032274 [Populus tomentosa]|uniref:SDH C-terminal domain-containing protein n=1 Tax=Populus tomentosa TaxID=118781 RepID=A0A8X7Z5N5_POPTO|nr:hypothetical protein POTOM_032274 [Populus tomentosa]